MNIEGSGHQICGLPNHEDRNAKSPSEGSGHQICGLTHHEDRNATGKSPSKDVTRIVASTNRGTGGLYEVPTVAER